MEYCGSPPTAGKLSGSHEKIDHMSCIPAAVVRTTHDASRIFSCLLCGDVRTVHRAGHLHTITYVVG